MADQGEVGQIVRTQGRDEQNALEYRLADIKSRADKLDTKVNAKFDEVANHVKVCERELRLLQREFYSFELHVDNCMCQNLNECRQISSVKLAEVDEILTDVQTQIWIVYAKSMDEVDDVGRRKSTLRETIQMVEGLPVFENLLDEDFFCEICEERWDADDLPCCHLPCDKAVIFHRVCLQGKFELIASINYQASELKTEITRQKPLYEADPDNRIDEFAFQLYMSVRFLGSLQTEFYNYKMRVDFCKCDNPNPQCIAYCDPLEELNDISLEIINLIRECWSDDLKERAERLFERKIVQLVEGLPAIRITDNHVNRKDDCVICLNDYEVGEEPCHLPCNEGRHLPCNEGHIFHRNCIADWFKRRQNRCPICRTPAYRPKESVYNATIRNLDLLSIRL